MRAPLLVLAVLCLPSVALASPGRLGGARHAGWLVAQAPMAAPGVNAELLAIDQRIAELLRDRPTAGRVNAGVVLTAGGALTLAGGAGLFIAFLSAGAWGALVAIIIGIPVMVVGAALLIPGIVLWVTGLSGQREADAELATLRARRDQLITPAPAPGPNVPPETIPQVWRDGPKSALALVRF